MRATLVHAILLTLIVVGVAAVPAFAQGDGGAPDQTAREERMSKLREARNESIRSFHENRSAAFADYHAAFNATKASFMENKTRVQAECAALRNQTAGGANETDDNATANSGGCVREGLKPLIQQARAEHKAQKDALRERLMDAREAAKASFQAARATYGPRGSG